MYNYPTAINKLIKEFNRLPGIGLRTAEKLVFTIFNYNAEEIERLVKSLENIRLQVGYCKNCYNLAEDELCEICKDANRDQTIICVVETFKDIVALEKTAEYNGVYHIIQGNISPVNGVFAENLKIKELLDRIKNNDIKEIILALSPTTEGEGTSLYIANEIKKIKDLQITQLSKGIPMGGEIEFADSLSLGKALKERRFF